MTTSTKTEYGLKGKDLPDGVKLRHLQENWDIAKREYRPIRKRMQTLDSIDSGKLWALLGKRFPQYQISPDTNHINYIKENILASIYTVGKGAALIPKDPVDTEMTDSVNKVMDSIWDILDVPSYQQKAGERAALMNIGITQVGWNQDLVGGTHGSWYKGDVVFKNIDPLSYFRDPFSNNLDEAAYVIHFEDHNLITLESNSIYKEGIKEYKKNKVGATKAGVEFEADRDTVSNSPEDDKHVRLIIHWVKRPKKGGGYYIHEIHTLNNDFVIHTVEDIAIGMFPFAELYCNEPGTDLIGVSEPEKILSSSLVVNILDGIVATHAYKAQRPPKLVNPASGLNIREFAKHGNDPDKTFIANNPQDAVHYIAFPPLPNGILEQIARLDGSIKNMSGIDEKYTGKDTGSILTTGGIEAMLAQSTMRDVTKINLYEKYSKDLSRLVINHLIVHGDKRQYTMKDPMSTEYQSIELDFPNVPKDIQFRYALHISNQLPKNKMRLAQSADQIMEMSMQYQDPTGETPSLMTPEEWLEYQEFPQKDEMLKRMKMNREMDKEDEVIETLSMFTGLLAQGASPEEALQLTVDAMMNPEEAEQGGGALGSVAQSGEFGGSPQSRQGQ